MGRRGPAPKPTALRVLHGDKPSRINFDEPKPREGVPSCPSWLDEDARKVWRYTIAELKAMGIVTRADRDALATYCAFVVQFERATKLVQTHGALVKGRDGGIVKNPAAQLMRDAADMVKKLGAEFGLSPRARSEIKASPEHSDDELQRLLS